MIEYLAAANAAYSVIKKAVQNGAELSSVGKHIATFTDSTDKIRNRKVAKQNSIWSKFTGKEESDLEEFMALEELRAKEEELKRLMIYVGRPGLHSDWVRFQVEARKSRQQAAEDKQKAAAKLQQTIEEVAIWILIVVVLGGIAAFTLLYLRKQGHI